MNENLTQVIVTCKLLWIIAFSALYAFGGISNKWLRRYVGPAWLSLGVFVFGKMSGELHWWYFLYPVLLSLTLHLGYGADETFEKIKRRGLYGLLLGIAALPLVFAHGYWLLFGIHCSFCIFSSIVLGVFNPTGSARSEESLIAVGATLIPLFLI